VEKAQLPNYRIDYSPETEEHLRALTARRAAEVLDAVIRQLGHQPTTETRNRKRMRPNPLAPWELRIGPLRVYYDVADEPQPVVRILAVGVKRGNAVIIGGKHLKL
jgi:mRNA-degrading endonuclease RelE of RelBE toxin-antitoxin system